MVDSMCCCLSRPEELGNLFDNSHGGLGIVPGLCPQAEFFAARVPTCKIALLPCEKFSLRIQSRDNTGHRDYYQTNCRALLVYLRNLEEARVEIERLTGSLCSWRGPSQTW